MLVNIVVRLLGSLTVLVSMLIGALAVTIIMVFGSTTELFEPIYPERLFFQIFGWFVTGAVIVSSVFAFFLRKKKLDYPTDDSYEHDSWTETERRLRRNNTVRIVLSILIISGGIINQWFYDLPFGRYFYLFVIIICIVFDLTVRIVDRKL